jgi:hypothetical protein
MTTEPTHGAGGAGPRPPGQDRSIGELFGDLAAETSTLVRREVQLAATELTNKASYAGKQTALIAVGALLGVASLLSLVAALVIGLDRWLALWLSALLVGLAVGAVAYGVVVKGIAALRKLELKPKHTIESLQENKAWAERQIR